MSTLAKQVVKQVVIPDDRHIDIDLPAEVPLGKAVITMTIESVEEAVNRVGELYGTDKGEFWMADDFDAPMEDFKDYM